MSDQPPILSGDGLIEFRLGPGGARVRLCLLCLTATPLAPGPMQHEPLCPIPQRTNLSAARNEGLEAAAPEIAALKARVGRLRETLETIASPDTTVPGWARARAALAADLDPEKTT